MDLYASVRVQICLLGKKELNSTTLRKSIPYVQTEPMHVHRAFQAGFRSQLDVKEMRWPPQSQDRTEVYLVWSSCVCHATTSGVCQQACDVEFNGGTSKVLLAMLASTSSIPVCFSDTHPRTIIPMRFSSSVQQGSTILAGPTMLINH